MKARRGSAHSRHWLAMNETYEWHDRDYRGERNRGDHNSQLRKRSDRVLRTKSCELQNCQVAKDRLCAGARVSKGDNQTRFTTCKSPSPPPPARSELARTVHPERPLEAASPAGHAAGA